MIKSIEALTELNELLEWRTLATEFGNVESDLEELEDGDIDRDDTDVNVLVWMVDGEAVGYLTAQGTELWCIEVLEAYRGSGIASKLVTAANIDFAWEVTSAEAAQLFDKMLIEFDDCRGA